MTARRFPRSPPLEPRAFAGGQNPFAEDVASPVAPRANPLAGPVTDEVQPFRADEYEQTQSDRSFRVLFLGMVGAGFAVASALISIVIATRTSLADSEMLFAWPAALAGLAFCIPAWVLGNHDLRAMQAGAMDPRGRRRVQIGSWCGGVGVLLEIIVFLLPVVALIRSFLS